MFFFYQRICAILTKNSHIKWCCVISYTKSFVAWTILNVVKLHNSRQWSTNHSKAGFEKNIVNELSNPTRRYDADQRKQRYCQKNLSVCKCCLSICFVIFYLILFRLIFSFVFDLTRKNSIRNCKSPKMFISF